VKETTKRLLTRAVPVLGVLLAGLALALYLKRDEIRRRLVIALETEYENPDPAAPLRPRFEGQDERRKRIAIDLTTVADGIEQPTDIQFPPGIDGYAVVLSKTGTAHWLRLDGGTHGELFRVAVETDVEEGLLGLAFHPKFAQNGRFFINYVAAAGGKDMSRVAEWRLAQGGEFRTRKASAVRTLLEVEQPYANHNGGALAFGPDGQLYIGFGDGGFRDDPHGHGQNGDTLLGSMLRIDVDETGEGHAYGIPRDNPFLGKPGFKPETWAYGLRNPWRYSFDPQGRLIVADVGQNAWEELHIATAGDNLGWAIREGFACFAEDHKGCERKDLVDPIFVYGRNDGVSITGGFVYTGTRIEALHGLYVFGDFGSGRLFALRLPEDRKQRVQQPIALGRWPIMPTTFGRDHQGELYLGEFKRGAILRIVPAKPDANRATPR
jgi:glucose/arabinose dehydrogenase